MSNLRKIITWISAFAITISMLCIPSLAASGSTYEQKVGFWDWAVQYSPLKGLLGYTLGLGSCPKSDDGYHHANSYQVSKGNGEYGCICSYCGHEFTAYESDLKQSYTKQVSELPATGINSAGRLIWQPSVDDLDPAYSFDVCYTGNWLSYKFSDFPASSSFCRVSFNPEGTGVCIAYMSAYMSARPGFAFYLPVSGAYCRLASPRYSASGTLENGSAVNFEGNYSVGSFSHFDAGTKYSTGSTAVGATGSNNWVSYGIMNVYFPVFEVIPDTTIDTSAGGQYSITNRPTSITGGNYGIVGDNGTINTITNNKPIINEITNIFYNPTTGQEYPIGDWTYNYENRTYTITLDTGDTINVEYGDENITIVEGDTNYTIYYIVDGSGTGGETHVHEWVQTGAKQGNCLTPAQRTYTCSICYEQYTETDPVLGHSWHIIQTVSTKYDEDGNLEQEGYTIYECERCGEQYKATNDTGPPPSGGDSPGSSGGTSDDGESIWDKIGKLIGTIFEGLLGMIEAVLGALLDGLIALGGMLMDKLAGVIEVVLTIFEEVPKLFGGFLDFLSAMFPFLPDEIMLLLTFGIAALVFVGIIKAIRR